MTMGPDQKSTVRTEIPELLKKYNELSGWIEDEQTRMDEDPAILKFEKEYFELEARMETFQKQLDAHADVVRRARSFFVEKIQLHEGHRVSVFDKIRDSWTGELGDVKKLDVDDGDSTIHANVKITKSIEIVDKAMVVNVLVKNERVAEGVSTFNKKYLRTLMEAGVITPLGAVFDEKTNLTITIVDESDDGIPVFPDNIDEIVPPEEDGVEAMNRSEAEWIADQERRGLDE